MLIQQKKKMQKLGFRKVGNSGGTTMPKMNNCRHHYVMRKYDSSFSIEIWQIATQSFAMNLTVDLSAYVFCSFDVGQTPQN